MTAKEGGEPPFPVSPAPKRTMSRPDAEDTVVVAVRAARDVDREGLRCVLGAIAGIRCVEPEELSDGKAPLVTVVASPSLRWVQEEVSHWSARGPMVAITDASHGWTTTCLMGAGAQVVLDYSDPVARIVATVQGLAWQSHVAVPAMVTRWRAASTERKASETNLTPMDQRIWQAVAQGRSNVEIAERLGIKPTTVRDGITRIYKQLGVRHRAAAAALWWRQHEAEESDRGPPGRGGGGGER